LEIISIFPNGKALYSTACGDAYRAGLLHGMMHSKDWEETERIASHGTQTHSLNNKKPRKRLFIESIS
jgi:sugar/nucleoside kinase (ribokinase family)